MTALLGLLIAAGEVPLGGEWSFSHGPEFPGAAGSLEVDADGVLHLRYDFSAGGAYVACYRVIEPAQTLRAWRFRLRKPAEATITVRQTDSTGQTFQKSTYYDGAGWQELEVRPGGWSGYWGGANDGVFHGATQQIGILIEGTGLLNLVGELLIAEVVAEPGEADAGPVIGPFRGRYQVTDFGPQSGFATVNSSLADSRWRVDFGAVEQAALHHSISLFGSPKELRLTVRGGPPGARLTLSLGSHFQRFWRELGELREGETVFTLPAPPEGWQFGGGENDGRVHPPLRVGGLSIERGTAPAAPAELELVDLTCVTELPSDQTTILFATLREAGGDERVRRLRAECVGWNVTDQPVSGRLRCVLRDWDETVLHETAYDWSLPADGVRGVASINLAIPAGLNFCDTTFTFEAAGLNPRPATAAFTRGADDAGDPALLPESPWGMGVYLYRNANNPAGYESMDRVAALACAAGVKWSREEFQWHRIETAPGEFDYSFYDQMIATAHRHGISIYALLAYWNPHYESYTEAGIDAYCNWVRQLVRRYKDQIQHWEIYNEPNIFFWSGPKELYPVMLERAYAAIREEDPTAQVLGVSTAGIDRAFIQRVLDAGAPFDVLTIHPYRARLVERQFADELRRTAEQVGGRPVWITEMGWPTQIGGTPERQQAELLARCYLTAVASGAVQNMSWYNFRSDGDDPFYNEHNFGVVHHDLTPKPAYRALMTICRTLAGGETTVPEGLPDGLWGLRRGGATALWSPGAAVDLTLSCDGPALVSNLMGDEIAAGDGEVTVRLTRGKPIFVIGVIERVEAAAVEPAEPPGRLVF